MPEIIAGKIVGMDRYGYTIRTDPPNVQTYTHRQYEEVRVELIDGRHRTPEQLRKAWAIMADIAEWNGDDREDIYKHLRYDFTAKRVDSLQERLFHLSQATVTDAREFINYLTSFCLDYDVPLKRPLYETTDDVLYYVHECLTHKRCAVCGQKADLHHVDAVGMGRDRESIDHHGMRVLPLCREHHGEAHTMGNDRFCARYHLEPVMTDDEIIRIYRLGRIRHESADDHRQPDRQAGAQGDPER